MGPKKMNSNNLEFLTLEETDIRWELGDLLVSCLQQLGIEYVFGIPGGAIEPLYNALARSARRGGPTAIVSRHETGAVFMADGYTFQTGRLGVCCATTGPGTTNLVTGVASAYENDVPLLLITAQTALPDIGCRAFQDSSCAGIDSVGLFKHCTRYSTLVSHPNQLEQKLFTAVMIALGPHPGPVHLSIPVNILRAPARRQFRFNPELLFHKPSLFDPGDIEILARELESRPSTLFILGKGASEAMDTIITVAERVDAAIVATPHAKGDVDPYHPRFRGIFGYGGHNSARDALQKNTDKLIVCIGTLISERSGFKWLNKLAPRQRLIHIDSKETHFPFTPMSNMHIRGNISAIFSQLSLRLEKTEFKKSDSKYSSSIPTNFKHTAETTTQCQKSKLHFALDDELSYLRNSTPIEPQRLMRELPNLFPSNTCYLIDSGSGLAWALHYLHPRRYPSNGAAAQRCWFHAAIEFTSMGWAIGAATGAALGNRHTPIVCITGDGSFLMSGQEITVAIQEKLAVVYIVLNDQGLGMVKHGQRLNGAEPIGYEMPVSHFAEFAQSLGAQAYTIKSPMDFLQFDARTLFDAEGPTLLDVHINPDAPPPLTNRIETLGKRYE